MRVIVEVNPSNSPMKITIDSVMETTAVRDLLLLLLGKLQLAPEDAYLLRVGERTYHSQDDTTLHTIRVRDASVLQLVRADDAFEVMPHMIPDEITDDKLANLLKSIRIGKTAVERCEFVKRSKIVYSMFQRMNEPMTAFRIEKRLVHVFQKYGNDFGAFFLMSQQIELESCRFDQNNNSLRTEGSTTKLLKKVNMLYARLNIGNEEIIASIDTGAQRTLISSSTVERCGLKRKVDTRYVTTLCGIGGRERTFGHIFNVILKVGERDFAIGASVASESRLGTDIDMILGLDVLLSEGAKLDLKARTFSIDDNSAISFLTDEESSRIGILGAEANCDDDLQDKKTTN